MQQRRRYLDPGDTCEYVGPPGYWIQAGDTVEVLGRVPIFRTVLVWPTSIVRPRKAAGIPVRLGHLAPSEIS